MKKTAALMMAAVLAAALAGCDGGKETARTPSSSFSFEGDHYREVADEFEDCGFLNIRGEEIADLPAEQLDREGEVAEVLVGGTSDYATDQVMDRNTEVLIRYHTAARTEQDPLPSDTGTAATEDFSVLTPENNADFASLAEKEASAEEIRAFARQYEDRTAEFDAVVIRAENHEDEHDSFDYVIKAEGSENGTPFLLEDVELYDCGLRRKLETGDRIRVSAEIGELDGRSGCLELDPVSIRLL